MLSFDEQKGKIRKSIWESFLVSGLLLVFSFVLLFKEENVLGTLILAIGLLGIVFGVMHFPIYFRLPKETRIYSNDLMKGIVFILFGGIAVLKSDILIDVVTILIGAYLIYKSANRVQICLNFSNSEEKKWKYLAGFSFVSIVLGILILFNPFPNLSLTMVLSVCVIASECISILQSIAMLVLMRRTYGKEEK